MRNQIRTTALILSGIYTLLACHANPAYLGPKPLEIYAVTTSTPGFTQVSYSPKIDILFIIDDSMSMSVHQDKLAANIDRFVDAFKEYTQVDFHIGVTTVYDAYSAEVQKAKSILPGSAVAPGGSVPVAPGGSVPSTKPYILQPPAGSLRPLKYKGILIADNSQPQFITRETTNFVDVLKETLKVGDIRIENGGTEYEESFSPVKGAFSEPIMNSPSNRGFFREDAKLMMIFITDTDDQTGNVWGDPLSGFDLHQYLLSLKKGDASKLAYYAILANLPQDSKCSSRPEDEEPMVPNRILALLSYQENRTPETPRAMSLCSDFGPTLALIGEQERQALVERVIVLPEWPEQDETHDITVSFGMRGSDKSSRQIIPKANSYDGARLVPVEEGWEYDPSTRKLVIHGGVKIKPQAGAELLIEYTPVVNPAK